MLIHVNNFNAEQCLFFSVKNKGRYNINKIERKVSFQKCSYFFLSKVHSILLVGGFEGACQSNHRIIDRLAGDGGGGCPSSSSSPVSTTR